MQRKIFKTFSLATAILLLLGLGITGREAHAEEPMLHIVNTTEDLRDFAQNGVCSAGEASYGPCSLRAAIYEAARRTSGKVTIEVPPGVYKLTLTGPDDEEDHYGDLDFPDLDDGEATDITIIGTGEWDNPSVIDANFIDRVMEIGKNQKIRLENLVLKNGLAISDEDQPDYFGGGLKIDRANVTLVHVRLTNNEARVSDEVGWSYGGGIYNDSSPLSLEYCELDHNKADSMSTLYGTYHDDPTYIWASSIHHNTVNTVDWQNQPHIKPGKLVMVNSAIYENQGGGRIFITTSPLVIQNSTIISRGELGIVNNQSGNLALLFNILQVIPTPGVGSGGEVCYLSEGNEPSHGGNFFSDDSCGPTTADAVIPYSGMSLGPLANYGGWTPTISLRPASPAVDFGSGKCPGLVYGQTLAEDQRDKDRDSRCDSGSFELQPGENPTVVYLPLIIK